MMGRVHVACSAALLALIFSTVAHARDAGSFDRYGYLNYESSSAQCGYQYVDASGGNLLGLTPASAMAPASDDGAALLTLAMPFELYGVSGNALIASSNGYLAAADDLAREDGGDFSADCPLPAIADNVAATQSRIYVYHADLDGAPNTGSMFSRYFPSCPRTSDSGIDEACTVVQWQNWALRGQPGALDMQAVLYHATFEIALQYQALDASSGSTATIGTQSDNATSGNALGCAGSRSMAPATALCIFDPRFPPGSQGIADRIFSNGFELP
jgi:hypothetical protein